MRIQLDWDCDFAETQHVNQAGSLKITKFLGKWITDQYSLTDHRREKEYHDWNAAYISYLQYKKNI